MDRLEDGPQLAPGDALEHVALDARLHGRPQVVLVLGAREHDHARRGRGRADQPSGLDAAARHRDVEQGEIGLMLAGGRDRGRRVAARADDLELVVGREGRDETVEEERVVVHDEDADRRRSCVRPRPRSGERQRGADAGAGAGRGLELEPTAEQLGPLAHAGEAEMPVAGLAGRYRTRDPCR